MILRYKNRKLMLVNCKKKRKRKENVKRFFVSKTGHLDLVKEGQKSDAEVFKIYRKNK